ncbi:nitroreductase/quinone reductase family protein [Halosimplex sp. TS25]|uniref:nitroreductase/quinone reductase family protein n=1 Tax=Halosimplex rarum TaxID=3396619 RepID=UPI0039ECF893
MTDRILVTGATGTVGQHVVTELADRDATVRVATRDPEAARERFPGAAEHVAFDFDRPETWGAALADVDGCFLMRPPTTDTGTVGEFAAAADRVGVERVAYLSTIGAEKNPLIPHHRIEKRIAETDLDYTFLRASFFAQNLSEVHGEDVVERDQIFVPAGDGATSFVDARDVGAVAAVVLTESGHENRAYDLTGPEALTYGEVATVFSDALDRPITYADPSVFAFGRRMRSRGEPLPFVVLMVGIYTTARLGLAGRVTDDAERLLGRPPRDVATFAADYADEFRPADDRQYVDTRGPPVPDAAYRVINPVVERVLRSPRHSLMSDSLMLLTFTGRKSGREYTIPVGYWVDDGTLIVTTHSPWWRNLRDGAPVDVLLRGERHEGVATARPDSADVARYMERFIERNGVDAARRLGIAVAGDRAPTRAELEAGVEGTVVVEIELERTEAVVAAATA